jgi:hypothetical protein
MNYKMPKSVMNSLMAIALFAVGAVGFTTASIVSSIATPTAHAGWIDLIQLTVAYLNLLSAATALATTIFTPTQAQTMTGEEAVKVIRVFGEYMDNLQKIFQHTPIALQPEDRIPNPGTGETQPEPDTTEFESN